MSNLAVINREKEHRYEVMKELMDIFYSYRKYVNIVEYEAKKGKSGKEYFENMVRVYNYFCNEQKAFVIDKIKSVFKLNNLSFSLNDIENIEFKVVISSWIDNNDIDEYEKLKNYYDKLIENNNKKWKICMEKYKNVMKQHVNTMFSAPAYRFFLPDYEKISDNLLLEMDKINERSSLLADKKYNALSDYENYLIHTEALNNLNHDIRRLYEMAFTFLWSKIKESNYDELMEVKYILK